MLRRAIRRRDRPAEPQLHRDGLVVAVLRLARWQYDPDVALLHSGTGGNDPHLQKQTSPE